MDWLRLPEPDYGTSWSLAKIVLNTDTLALTIRRANSEMRG
jgi:hypothetical protein